MGVVAAGAGISICAPVLFSIAGRGADEAVRGAAVSIVTTIAYLGFLVGPAAVGLLASATALETSLAAVAGVAWRWPSWRPRATRAPVSIEPQVSRRTVVEASVRPTQGARMIRLARWDVVASRLAPGSRDARGAQAVRSFAGPEHGLGFWFALWAVVIAAEFGALVPVSGGTGSRSGDRDGLPPDRRIVRRVRPDRLAPAPRQPQRPAHDRDRLRVLLSPLMAQFETRDGADRVDRVLRALGDPFFALMLTLLTGGRLVSPVDWLRSWRVRRSRSSSCRPSGCCSSSRRATSSPRSRTRTSPTPSTRASAREPRRLRRGVVLVATQWRAASPPRRRALLPSVAGSASHCCSSPRCTSTTSSPAPSQRAPLWLAICSLAAVPPRSSWAAALAPRARRPRRSVPRPQATRGSALQAALADPRRPGLSSPTGSRAATPTPTADWRRRSRCRSPATVARIVAGRAQRPRDRGARLRRPRSTTTRSWLEAVSSAAAAIALEHEHLHAESQGAPGRAAVRRASALVAAGDAERRRLERNLHDGAQQRLVALAMQLRFLQGRIRRRPVDRGGAPSRRPAASSPQFAP